VIDVELLSVIRRWHHRDHIPIREIERRTGLSRNTIRKYLRSNAVEVRFKVPERPSRLDPFADKLSEWLRLEAGKGRKGRRTVRQIHADLVTLGYRAFVIRAYKLQTREMLFDALAETFRVLGGVPRRGIFDHMRTAVDRVGTGKARQVNARLAAMASHYLFEATLCNPASG
jgi:transposase